VFKRISVAYSESPEARLALTSAVHLAKTLGAELRAVTILQAPPAYTAYADAVDPSLKLIINSDRMQAYERFMHLHRMLLRSVLGGPLKPGRSRAKFRTSLEDAVTE
jgi:nucleotide-binding universal stress UspA family protein